MEEKSKDYTTFVSSRGLMRFRVMPFGMVNSGSTYNRKLLEGTQNLESYVDDVLGTQRAELHIWKFCEISLRESERPICR